MKNFWNDLTFEEIEDISKNDSIVIIPIGSVEQHGKHLPVGTDSMLAFEVAKDVSERIINNKVIYTMPVWTGFSPYHMKFGGTITLDLKLFIDIVSSICICVATHGFKRIILLNGHGGNIHILRSLCNELKAKFNISPITFNYWDVALDYIKKWRDSGLGGINHAGEMETSLMLYKRKELVKEDRFEKSIYYTKSKYLTKDLAVGGITSFPFDVKEAKESGVLGDPTLASLKKGKDLYEKIIDALINFLIEFKDWEIEDIKNL